MKIRSILGTTLAVAGIAAMAMPSFAAGPPVTFAQFQQAVSGNQFTFTNNSTSPNNLKLTASLDVNFEYLTPNLYGAPNTPIAAKLVVTAIANPASLSGAATTIDQPFSSVTMTFTAVTPKNGHSNLLTVETGTTGDLTGKKNANSAALNGDAAAGDTVNFSSDFLFFSPGTLEAYTLSFTSLTPKYILATTTSGHQTKNFPVSFTAAGTGTFDSTPGPNIGVPEPSPALALCVGAGLGLFLILRARKASSPLNA